MKTTETNLRLERRKIDVLFRQAPVAITASATAALFLFVVFWQTAGNLVVGAWFGCYFLLYTLRYYLIHRYNSAPADSDPDLYLKTHLGGTVISGLLWSVIALYMLGTGDSTNLIMVLLFTGGLVAGAVSTNTVKLSAYYAFVLPISIPVIVYLLLNESSQLNLFGLILTTFVVFVSFSAYRLNHLVTESLSYQFDNLQLLNELEQEKNQVTRLYSNLEFDLAKRRKAEEQLKYEKEKAEELAQSLLAISTLDGLTGIPNRRHFDSTLAKEWNRAGRTGSPVALIMCDIDHFKSYNDHYGHQKGDSCLIQVAHLLQEHARREGDVAARYGGEEFAIILPATSLENATDIAEQMRVAIEDLSIPHRWSGNDNTVTASFGVATIVPQREQKSRILLTRADKALYAAKTRGRNCVVTMSPELVNNGGGGYIDGEETA